MQTIEEKIQNQKKAITLFRSLLDRYDNPPEVTSELKEEIKTSQETIRKLEAEKQESVSRQEFQQGNNVPLTVQFDLKRVKIGERFVRYTRERLLLEHLLIEKEIHYLSYLKICPSWKNPKKRTFETITSRLNTFLKRSGCGATINMIDGICTINGEENIISNIQESFAKAESAQQEKDPDKKIILFIETVTLYNKNFDALRSLLQELQNSKTQRLDPKLAGNLISSLNTTTKTTTAAIDKLSKLPLSSDIDAEKTCLEYNLIAEQELAKKLLSILQSYLKTNKITISTDKEYEELKKTINSKGKISIINNPHIKKLIKNLAYSCQKKNLILRKISIKNLSDNIESFLIGIIPAIKFDFDKTDSVSGLLSYLYKATYGAIVDRMATLYSEGKPKDYSEYREYQREKSFLVTKYKNQGMSEDEADIEAEEEIKKKYGRKYNYIQEIRSLFDMTLKSSYIDEMTENPQQKTEEIKEKMSETIEDD